MTQQETPTKVVDLPPVYDGSDPEKLNVHLGQAIERLKTVLLVRVNSKRDHLDQKKQQEQDQEQQQDQEQVPGEVQDA